MESPKLKKITGWLLYHLGVQPTEPRRGELVLTDSFKNSLRSGGSGWFWRYRWLVLSGLGMLIIAALWWSLGPVLAKAQVGGKTLTLGKSDEVLAQQINVAAAGYSLPVAYADGHARSYPLKEVGFSVNDKQTVSDWRAEQQSFAQRFMWWRVIKKPLAVQANAHVLHAFIATHITASVQPSQDATLAIENGTVTTHDAVTGKQYGLENPQISILNHVSSLQKKPLQVKLITLNPAVTAEELAASKSQLEQVLNQPISFTIDTKTVTPTKKDIAAWLELTPNSKTKKVDVDINSGKVQEYINKIAAANVHPARDQIEITHDDGTTSVLVPGVNGVDVSNKQAIATNVANNLLASKGIQANLSVNFSPYKTVSTAAYPKWIEVDLTNKRMYAYEQTSLIKTFLVSAGAPKTPTVTGKYAVYAKYSQKDMRGRNVDGSNYFQPHVPWVNFFYKDYAIHGNYWRPTSYFGNINSSHGCVSTVPSEAAWMYDWAPIGTPVIIHT